MHCRAPSWDPNPACSILRRHGIRIPLAASCDHRPARAQARSISSSCFPHPASRLPPTTGIQKFRIVSGAHMESFTRYGSRQGELDGPRGIACAGGASAGSNHRLASAGSNRRLASAGSNRRLASAGSNHRLASAGSTIASRQLVQPLPRVSWFETSPDPSWFETSLDHSWFECASI